MTVRFYSSIAVETTLTSGITPSATTINVASTTGFPGSFPYTLALDFDSAGNELVDVTAAAGLSLTVTRAVDGTAASSHNSGAVVRHVISGRDEADSRSHENASTNVHGLAGGAAVVGTSSTQTLSNKTLDRATGDLQSVDIFNVGASWRTAIVGDSTAPTADRLAILNNEVSLGEEIEFKAGGHMMVVNQAGAADSTTKISVVDTNQTDVRFAVTGGGSMLVLPNSTSTQASIGVGTTESNTESAFQLSNPDGTNIRFLVTKAGVLTSAVTTASGASVFSVAAGWTLTSASARKTAGVVTVDVVVNRTGGTITGTAAGSASATQVGTYAAAWRPINAMSVFAHRSGNLGYGGGTVDSAGLFVLRSWHATAVINNGDDVLFSITHIPA